MQNSSTVDLLILRKQTCSKPRSRNDGRSIALVVEGGGMRSVVVAGMLSALEYLGLRDAFDAVYAVSGGAIGAAYFLAGQAQSGITTLYEDINNREFIDFTRVLRGKPLLSLGRVMEEIRHGRNALHFEHVLNSDISFRVLATSVDSAKCVIFDSFESEDDLLGAFHASALVPFFAGMPVPYRGGHYLDASLSVSIPFRAAVRDCMTDLVILSARSLDRPRERPSWINRTLVIPYLRRLNSKLARDYLNRADLYRSEIGEILDHIRGKREPKMLLISIPAGTPDIWAFEVSRKKLVGGAKAGFDAVVSLFEATSHDARTKRV